MDHRLVTVRAKTRWRVLAVRKMVVIGILQLSQRDMPKDFARYAIVGEVEAES
jgi:hypothetical protein